MSALQGDVGAMTATQVGPISVGAGVLRARARARDDARDRRRQGRDHPQASLAGGAGASGDRRRRCEIEDRTDPSGPTPIWAQAYASPYATIDYPPATQGGASEMPAAPGVTGQ